MSVLPYQYFSDVSTTISVLFRCQYYHISTLQLLVLQCQYFSAVSTTISVLFRCQYYHVSTLQMSVLPYQYLAAAVAGSSAGWVGVQGLGEGLGEAAQSAGWAGLGSSPLHNTHTHTHTHTQSVI